jgi:hypothetical protein
MVALLAAAPLTTMDSSTGPFVDEPYRPPATRPQKPEPLAGAMEYWRAWKYVFHSTQWVVTVLFITVAMFVPILGPLVVYGYQFEVVEGLHRSGGRSYPDFNLDRFADYLVRGVWVFLAMLLGGLALAPIYLLVLGCGAGGMIAVAAAAGSEDAAKAVFGAGLPLLIGLMVILALPLNVLLVPLVIRAGLTQDFGATFNFDWIKSFLSKTWREMILGTLFLAATGMLAGWAGALVCCVGAYPAAALVILAQSHIFYQFYAIFLARGGEPVPLKDPAQQGW